MALVETGFLFALAVYILIEAITRLAGHATIIEANSFAFGVLIVSIIVDLVRWRSLKRIAATTKSDALAADALHFSSDIVSSALALCGIAAARYGYPQGDALAALGLALFIAVAGLKIGRRTVNTLVARRRRACLANQVARAVRSGRGQVETLRLRPAGAGFGIAITVSRTLPLEKRAAIEANVAAAIAARIQSPSRSRRSRRP